MIVVADTSPINYLILIDEVHVLAALCGRVVIPASVREELLRPRSPDSVRRWVRRPPAWLEIRSPSARSDSSLAGLDPGERDVIALAEELPAEFVILDDLQGRREAERRHLHVIGTLGILAEAAEQRLLDLYLALQRLQQTSFHVSPQVLKQLLGPSDESP